MNSFKKEVAPWQLHHGIALCKPLYDPDGMIKKWKKILYPYPEWLRELKCKTLNFIFRHTRSDMIRRELKRGNDLYLRFRFWDSLQMVNEIIYALNREYYGWGGSTKWMFKDLERFKALPPGFRKKIETITKFDGSDMRDRYKFLDSINMDLLKIVKKEYPKMEIKTEWD
jgi:hypothetical protein